VADTAPPWQQTICRRWAIEMCSRWTAVSGSGEKRAILWHA